MVRTSLRGAARLCSLYQPLCAYYGRSGYIFPARRIRRDRSWFVLFVRLDPLALSGPCLSLSFPPRPLTQNSLRSGSKAGSHNSRTGQFEQTSSAKYVGSDRVSPVLSIRSALPRCFCFRTLFSLSHVPVALLFRGARSSCELVHCIDCIVLLCFVTFVLAVG